LAGKVKGPPREKKKFGLTGCGVKGTRRKKIKKGSFNRTMKEQRRVIRGEKKPGQPSGGGGKTSLLG